LSERRVDLHEQRVRPNTQLGVGDAQHVGVGRALAHQGPASRDGAVGAVAVLTAIERMFQDILDRLRTPRGAARGRNPRGVERYGGRVERAASLDAVPSCTGRGRAPIPIGRTKRTGALRTIRHTTVLVQPSLDAHWARRRHVRLRAAQHPAVNAPCDLDRVGVHIRCRHHTADDLALGLHSRRAEGQRRIYTHT
jgi:hypothetical protein